MSVILRVIRASAASLALPSTATQQQYFTPDQLWWQLKRKNSFVLIFVDIVTVDRRRRSRIDYNFGVVCYCSWSPQAREVGQSHTCIFWRQPVSSYSQWRPWERVTWMRWSGRFCVSCSRCRLRRVSHSPTERSNITLLILNELGKYDFRYHGMRIGLQ